MVRTGAAEDAGKESSGTEVELFSILNEDGVGSLCVLLNELMCEYEVSPIVARQVKIKQSASYYASGTLSPTLENEMHFEELLIISFL